MSDILRVLIADDERLALDRLLFAFRDIPDTLVVGTAENGIEAAAKIAALRPDVAILDIQMPGRSGVGIAASLNAADRPDIIFVTAFDHHAVEAFDLDAADYVLKPLRIDRLRQAIERVRRRRGRTAPSAPAPKAPPYRADDDCFWVKDGRGLTRISLEQVEWIEAAKDYVLLHTVERSYILRATMGAIEAQFPPPRLLRVHRSAFVRPEAVQVLQRSAVGGATLVLAHGVAVRVGTTYLPDVTRRFA